MKLVGLCLRGLKSIWNHVSITNDANDPTVSEGLSKLIMIT